jgi:protein-tyrosine phosphatase
MDTNKILFVCLGNICRSPSAEIVMVNLIEKHGLNSVFDLDSAGIIDNHEGQMADSRMRVHALRRGLTITHRSRPVNARVDFEYFDMIIGMDDDNMKALDELARIPTWKNKLYRMTDFSKKMSYNYVPDPYYGGDKGFELVLDILEDACEGLLEFILHRDAINRV